MCTFTYCLLMSCRNLGSEDAWFYYSEHLANECHKLTMIGYLVILEQNFCEVNMENYSALDGVKQRKQLKFITNFNNIITVNIGCNKRSSSIGFNYCSQTMCKH